ncbi:regulator of chromosome condensation 1/beta-lactamase-inhibitor protein II [Parasitella parasitica]|nr:regulator of chromosome condensation 1/beta-lactamase-inhibitor protein II [Parasitella parasitica]
MVKLYAFGSNGSGQLGIGHTEDTSTPTQCLGLPSDDPIVKVSGGGNHSAVLTKQGRIYMAGLSQFGEDHMKKLSQNSDQDNKDWLCYQRRFDSLKWKDVVCGWAFNIALSSTGKLYGVGTSRWNELAGPSTENLVELDINLTDIVSVACGWRHVVALNVHGQAYGWGWGRHGQLGPSDEPQADKRNIRHVQKIYMPQPIVQIACGHLHTLLRGQDGTVYALGSNKYGQLGATGDNHIMFNHTASWINAGWHHSAILDSSGKLELFGRNDHGQLGQAPENRQFSQIVCGSEHTIAITKDTNQVLTWGWNEHGNCTSDRDFVSDAIILDQFAQANIIGAGCATSWIGL